MRIAERKFLLAVAACLLPAIGMAADNSPRPNVIYIQPYRSYEAGDYATNWRNIEAVKELEGKILPLKAVVFEPDRARTSRLFCRASYPVSTPKGTPFTTFVENAINAELAASKLLVEGAERVILAKLEEFDFSSFGNGKWVIRASFSAEGKQPFVVAREYPFSVRANPQLGCADVTDALVPAVQLFLRTVYADPRFAELAR